MSKCKRCGARGAPGSFIACGCPRPASIGATRDNQVAPDRPNQLLIIRRGGMTDQKPCIHRGDLEGEANCGCIGRSPLYRCKLLDQLCTPITIGKPGWKHVQGCSLCDHNTPEGFVRLMQPRILCEIPKPRSSRAVITVAPDPKTQAELAITRPAMQQYAKRHGFDFVEISALTPQDHPCGNKYAYAEVAASYEQSLWLDTDVVIMRSAPNIFDQVQPGQWGLCDDLTGLKRTSSSLEWFSAQWDALAIALDLPLYEIPRAWNSGVVVAPRNAADCYFPPAKPVPNNWCIEQHFHTRCLLDNKADVVDLDRVWNVGWWDYQFLQYLPTGHLIHIGGCRDVDLRLKLLKHFAAGRRDLPKRLRPKLPDWSPEWVAA